MSIPDKIRAKLIAGYDVEKSARARQVHRCELGFARSTLISCAKRKRAKNQMLMLQSIESDAHTLSVHAVGLELSTMRVT
jgi:hypothetical protein